MRYRVILFASPPLSWHQTVAPNGVCYPRKAAFAHSVFSSTSTLIFTATTCAGFYHTSTQYLSLLTEFSNADIPKVVSPGTLHYSISLRETRFLRRFNALLISAINALAPYWIYYQPRLLARSLPRLYFLHLVSVSSCPMDLTQTLSAFPDINVAFYQARALQSATRLSEWLGSKVCPHCFKISSTAAFLR